MDKISKLLYVLSTLIMLQACSTLSQEQRIIDQAIEAHGGALYKQVEIGFNFRDIHYQILKTANRFEYSREFTDSTGVVMDVLNDEGFNRTVDGEPVALKDEKRQAYTNSLNSVAYFAFLPYGLNDPAVRKEWIRETALEGGSYDLIKISFNEEGGGEDFDDEFLYWINNENHQVDYMAYSYHTEGGGVRFRKAVNSRMINGIRIQDYENYMPAGERTPVENLQELYQSGQLELLSQIVLEDIQVEKLE